MDDKIILYRTKTCPICKMIAQQLTVKGIKFEECLDIEVLKEHGFQSAPVLRIGDEFLKAKEALQWIKRQ